MSVAHPRDHLSSCKDWDMETETFLSLRAKGLKITRLISVSEVFFCPNLCLRGFLSILGLSFQFEKLLGFENWVRSLRQPKICARLTLRITHTHKALRSECKIVFSR